MHTSEKFLTSKLSKIETRYGLQLEYFPILQIVSWVAYKIQLPRQYEGIQPVLHVRLLPPIKQDPYNPIKYTGPGPQYEKKWEQYFEPEALANQRTVRRPLQSQVEGISLLALQLRSCRQLANDRARNGSAICTKRDEEKTS